MNEESEKILTSEFWAGCSPYIFRRGWDNSMRDQKFLDSSSCRPSVLRALVYKWQHNWFSDGRVSIK